jgi:hypothetical protein
MQIVWIGLIIAIFLLVVFWLAIGVELLSDCCDQIEHREDLQ